MDQKVNKIEMIEEIKISSTLRALLKWSKEEQIDFSPENIGKRLQPIYGHKLEIKDAIIVFFQAYAEALKEPRFEISKDLHVTLLDIFSYPCHNLHKANNGQEALGNYQKDILCYIMGQFRCTRVGWCRDHIFREEDVS